MVCVPAIFNNFKFDSVTFGKRCATCIPALFDSFYFGDTTFDNTCAIPPVPPTIPFIGGGGGGKRAPSYISTIYSYLLRNPVEKLSKEEIQLLVSILKQDSYGLSINESILRGNELNIPLDESILKTIYENIKLNSSINKDLKESIDVKSGLDYKKLIRILVGM
jgi:hypothetical protein